MKLDIWGFPRPTDRDALKPGDLFLAKPGVLGLRMADTDQDPPAALILVGGEAGRTPHPLALGYMPSEVHLIDGDLQIRPLGEGVATPGERTLGGLATDKAGGWFLIVDAGRVGQTNAMSLSSWDLVTMGPVRAYFPGWRLVLVKGEEEREVYRSAATRP